MRSFRYSKKALPLCRFSEVRVLLAAFETNCWMPSRRIADGKIITGPTRK